MGNWILKIPEWKGAIIFDYETVFFIMVLAMMLSGLILCCEGYRYFQTLCTLVVGSILGMMGVQIGEITIQNIILKMSFFVIFAFFGTFVFYVFLIPVKSIFKKLSIWNVLCSKQYLFAAILGGGMVAVVLYQYVYRSLLTAWALFAILAITGALWGKRQAAERKPFYTYDDLYKMEPLPEEGEAV